MPPGGGDTDQDAERDASTHPSTPPPAPRKTSLAGRPLKERTFLVDEPAKVTRKSKKKDKENTEGGNVTNTTLESLLSAINKLGESVEARASKTRHDESEHQDGLKQLHNRLDKREEEHRQRFIALSQQVQGIHKLELEELYKRLDKQEKDHSSKLAGLHMRLDKQEKEYISRLNQKQPGTTCCTAKSGKENE
jgi:septal ring factor EnvC (AmiA/AmiB activator)